MNKFNFAPKISLVGLRLLVIPFGALIGLLLLSFYTAVFARNRITLQFRELAERKGALQTLQNKVQKLESAKLEIDQFVDNAVLVLPQDNAALPFIAQIKSLASQEPVIIKNLKVAGETAGASANSFIEVELGVNGNAPQVLDFLQKMNHLAPLSTISEVTITKSGEYWVAVVKCKVYFAPYPQTISKISDPFQDLTADEEATLAKINGYSLPPVIETSPQGPVTRENPFQ